MTDTPETPNRSRLSSLTFGFEPTRGVAGIGQRSADRLNDWSELAIRTAIAINQGTLDVMTHQMVTQWIEQDKRTHTIPDGTSAAGRYYNSLKDTFGSPSGVVMTWMSMMPQWQRNMIFKNKAFQNVMRSEVMVRQFELIDSIIRKHYPDDHGTLFKPEYNHHFLSENSKNEIVAVDDEAIVALFKKPENPLASGADAYPRLLFTSSHAQGESLDDVTTITHGHEALARDSHNGKPLPHGHIDTGVKPGQTLSLYACDVEEGPWLNGAELLKRVLELKEIARTGQADRFEHISPGAKRIAKLMLKCMVEQPERIDTKDPRSLKDSIDSDAPPLVLREDAIEIANHFQLIGYSKGGNVVSDAMRYLVSEISAKNAQGATLFQTHPASPSHAAHGRDMNTGNIHDIVRGISVMALASIEVGMAQHYKDCGVRRVAFNNKHDAISEHSNYHTSMFDERYIIEGTSDRVGHHPSDMMGTRGNEIEEAMVGYAHEDEKVARRLMEFFAPNYNDAAIGHVYFDVATAREGKFTIEAASGTMDSQLEQYLDKIKAAFIKNHLLGVTIQRDPATPALFTVTCAPQGVPIDFTSNRAAIDHLRSAFHDLRKDKENPVVTMRIENEINAFVKQSGMKSHKPRGLWGMSGRVPEGGSALDQLTR